MKICAPATANPGIDLNTLDEININFTDKHSSDDLLEFCKKFKDKRINVNFHNSIDCSTIIACDSITNGNVFIRLQFEDIEKAKDFDDYGIKYFVDYPIDSYVKMNWFLLNTNVTDVYISDDLCYNLKNVSAACTSHNISVRMVLNRVQSSFKYAADLYNAPIFAPENFMFLSQYIDTAEFDCWDGDKYLWNMHKVLYKKWFVDNSYDRSLHSIVKEIEKPTPAFILAKDFFERRGNCKYRCVSVYDYPCSSCARAAQIMEHYFKE